MAIEKMRCKLCNRPCVFGDAPTGPFLLCVDAEPVESGQYFIVNDKLFTDQIDGDYRFWPGPRYDRHVCVRDTLEVPDEGPE